MYFAAQADGGAEPYNYQWDFDNNGQVDSTVQNPQWTFSYNEAGVKPFTVRLTITDNNGETVIHDQVVVIEGIAPAPPGGEFEIILSSEPAGKPGDPYPVIELEFDPDGITENTPEEPLLDLSVLVDPANPGKPPYEYYWDFEDDNEIDSQYVSPTIPYYDESRKILVNPYLHLKTILTPDCDCTAFCEGGIDRLHVSRLLD